MDNNNNQKAFIRLLKAGLWEEHEKQVSLDYSVDWNEIYRYASEQMVLGLVLAGIERLSNDQRPPKEMLLQWIGEIQMLEQRNLEMNRFIGLLVDKMRKEGIYTLLVKGQGIAQCYERPLLRSSGDVDFFMSETNYKKAKEFLLPLSRTSKPERAYSKELGLSIDPWYVEIHGSQRTCLSTRVDSEIDAVQRSVFYEGKARSWMNGKTQIFLPAQDEDVFIVFTHFLKHLFKEEGASIRQLCDLCRLLWTYKNKIDGKLLAMRLKGAGIMTEWKAFGACAVEYLGMPVCSMPLYVGGEKWKKKGRRMMGYILNGTNHGRFHAFLSVLRIFPMNALRFAVGILFEVNFLKIKENFCNRE